MINYFLLISRQGKVRLAKWYATIPNKTKTTIVRDATRLVLDRKPKMCNIIEYKARKLIYKRYASLFFVMEIENSDNELEALEIIHRYVEILDQFFGNVCELDLIFNFDRAYLALDELILGGTIHESSKRTVTNLLLAWQNAEERDTLTHRLTEASILV